MIKIYTCSHNRPDFIDLQYKTLKKHIKDDFEFIVFNNERVGGDGGFDSNRISEIDEICKLIGVKSIRVELDPEMQFLGGMQMFAGDNYTNGNTACAYSFTWAWKNYIMKNECISIFIDSDMFFIRDISLEKEMDGFNLAYVPAYRYFDNPKKSTSYPWRGDIAFTYPWNGIFICKPNEMPNVESLSFANSYVNSIATDVGGEAHNYIEKYKDDLKIRYIDQMSLGRDCPTYNDEWRLPPEKGSIVEIGINGCAPMYLNFDNVTVEILAHQYSDQKTFPHQKERGNYWEYLYNIYDYIIKFVNSKKFPKPSFIDFIKFEDEDAIETSFIFHYKNASNTLPWMIGENGENYNKEKTECLKKFLND